MLAFISFVLISAHVMLNPFVGSTGNSLQAPHREEEETRRQEGREECAI